MPTARDFENVEFGGPAVYRIVVKGRVGGNWSDRLAGMTIHTIARKGMAPRTTLLGPIKNQSELNAVLETLYALHLPILAVEQIEGPN